MASHHTEAELWFPPKVPPLETARSWEISMVGDLEMEYEIG